MNSNCPRFIVTESNGSAHSGPCSGPAVPKGFYFRSSDSRTVRRFRCKRCLRHFSQATRSPCFGQKKRRLNHEIERLYCSGVSQRRLALILGVNRKTVVRKVRFLAAQAREEH